MLWYNAMANTATGGSTIVNMNLDSRPPMIGSKHSTCVDPSTSKLTTCMLLSNHTRNNSGYVIWSTDESLLKIWKALMTIFRWASSCGAHKRVMTTSWSYFVGPVDTVVAALQEP